MSLSPFDSFQSRFVTYLLNFPRTTILPTIYTLIKQVASLLLESATTHKHNRMISLSAFDKNQIALRPPSSNRFEISNSQHVLSQEG